jgi:hypothetical protein
MNKHLLVTLALLLPASLHAVLPATQKLLPNFASSSQSFGYSAAASPNWIAIGASSENGYMGAAYIYNSTSGTFVRRLLAPAVDAAPDDMFGNSVAISGNYAAISAPAGPGTAGSNQGCVYVFNVSTGVMKFKLTASDAADQDYFGSAVAIEGNRVLVGARNKASGEGRAYLYDLGSTSATQIRTFDDAAAGYEFGASVALSGNLAAIGAPSKVSTGGSVYLYDIGQTAVLREFTRSGGIHPDRFGISLSLGHGRLLVGAEGVATYKGEARLFNVSTGALTGTYTLIGGLASDSMGSSVALSGSLAIIGASGANSYKGKALIVDLISGSSREVSAPDGASGDLFGFAVAASGQSLIVGAPYGQGTASGSGAAYIFRGLAHTLPGPVITQKGETTTGIIGTTYAAFTSWQLNSDNESLLFATTAGTSSPAGATCGIWHNLAAGAGTALKLRAKVKGTFSGNQYYSSLAKPVFNDAGKAFWRFKIEGTPMPAPTMDEFSFADNGISLSPDSAEGLLQLARNAGTLGTVSKKTGLAATADTEAFFDIQDTDLAAATEGDDTGVGATNTISLGEIAPRVAPADQFGGFVSALVHKGTPTAVTSANNAALLYVDTGTSQPQPIMRKGDTITSPLMGAGTVSSFVSELCNSFILAKVMVTGAGSEALIYFHNRTTLAPVVVIRKGEQVNGMANGIKWASIVRFWTSDAGFFALAKMSGPGITKVNDTALFRWNNYVSGAFIIDSQVLMRTGDTAPGCNGAKIGALSSIDVNRLSSSYAIIATLTGVGSTAADNLALFEGKASLGLTGIDEIYAAPYLRLRKGTYLNTGTTTPAVIKSMTMTVPVDASGAGNRGLGNTVGNNAAAVLMTLADGRVLATTL